MTRRELLAAAPTALAAQPNQTLHQLFDSLTTEWMRLNPESSTETRFFPPAEQDVHDGKLSPPSAQADPARLALARRGLAQLARFDLNRVSAAERVYAETLRWQLESIAGEEPFLELSFPINQFFGVQTSLTLLLTDLQPIRNRRDADNWLARLRGSAPIINAEIDTMRDRAGRGIRPPSFILNETIGQMKRFIAPPPEQNVLATVFAQKLAEAKVPGAQQLNASAVKLLSESLYPAYRRANDTLATIGAKATPEAGIRRLPHGLEAYAFFLRRYTTTTLTADEIHRRGLDEVKRIESEMEALLKPLGYTNGTIAERMRQLENDQVYPNTPHVREQVLADYARYIREANDRAAADFAQRPKAPCIVQRIPAFQEANSAANYQPPPADGSRPGLFRVPLPGPTYSKVGMRTLAYHEAIPGHHYQIALQVENTAIPRFLRDSVFGVLSAYAEGWGLYAERLASDLGWYKNDPVGDLGRLSGELFRARRLVVDTGLHTKGWTREQAIQYGIPQGEVDRYTVWPGQACSYKIGQLKLLELRDNARRALGPKFSLKEFHTVVLRNGSLPLAILEGQVNAWVKSRA